MERCGVPYSCCHSTDGTLVNLMCGFNVQEETDTTEVLRRINIRGCIPTIQVGFNIPMTCIRNTFYLLF